MRSKYRQLRVGLAGLGLQAYWDQFRGLEERLLVYLGEVEAKLACSSRVIVNLGLVDSPEKAIDGGHRARQGRP